MNDYLEKYIERLYESLEEEANAGSGMNYYTSYDSLMESGSKMIRAIEDIMYQYSEESDFVNKFKFPENPEDREIGVIEDELFVTELYLKEFLVEKKIKSISNDLLYYCDEKIKSILITFDEEKINYLPLLEKEKIKSVEDFEVTLFQSLFKNYDEKIRSLFNDRIKNPLYQHFTKLLKSDLENEFFKYLEAKKDIYSDIVGYKADKQQIIKDFNKKIKNFHFEYVEAINSYKIHENLFNNLKKLNKDNREYLNILEYNQIELINDKINSAIEDSLTRKFAKSILGSYIHLMDHNGFKKLEYLRNSKISKERIKKALEKVALFDNSSILNNELDKIIKGQILEYNEIFDDIKEKDLNVNVVLDDKKNNILVLKVNDLKASSTLGSGHWCISKNQSNFNQYLSTTEKRNHFFVYDFNRPEDNVLHFFAFTMSENGNITAAFNYKNSTILQSMQAGKVIESSLIDQIKENYILLLKKENYAEKIKEQKVNLSEIVNDIPEVLNFIKENLNFIKNVQIKEKDIFTILNDLDKYGKNNSLVENIDTLLTISSLINCNLMKNNNFINLFKKLNNVEKMILKTKHNLEINSEKQINKIKPQ